MISRGSCANRARSLTSEQAHPFPRLASESAVLDFIKSGRIHGSDDMRKISLSALLIGSVIPPLVVYLARDDTDLALRASIDREGGATHLGRVRCSG